VTPTHAGESLHSNGDREGKAWRPNSPAALAFDVLGGYILTAGLFTLHLARTTFRRAEPGPWLMVAVTGSTSLIWMTVVNFRIASEFRWRF